MGNCALGTPIETRERWRDPTPRKQGDTREEGLVGSLQLGNCLATFSSFFPLCLRPHLLPFHSP